MSTGEVSSIGERLQREIDRNKVLTSKCVKLEQDRESIRESLKVLDAEKDFLGEKCDELEEKVRLERGRGEDEVRRRGEVEAAINELQGRSDVERRALDAREKEIMRMTGVMSTMQSDLEEMKRVCLAREREVERLGGDLMNMTREAQALGIEGGRASGELGSTRKKLDEISGKLSAAEHRLRGVEAEKSDLLAAYRAVVDERGELEGGVEELGVERNNVKAELAACHGEVERQKAVIVELEVSGWGGAAERYRAIVVNATFVSSNTSSFISERASETRCRHGGLRKAARRDLPEQPFDPEVLGGKRGGKQEAQDGPLRLQAEQRGDRPPQPGPPEEGRRGPRGGGGAPGDHRGTGGGEGGTAEAPGRREEPRARDRDAATGTEGEQRGEPGAGEEAGEGERGAAGES